MGIIVVYSMLFRMQLAWPEESFKIFNILLGDKLLPNGVMANDIYLALVTIHGTMVFFLCTNRRVKNGTLVTFLFHFKLVQEIWHLVS
jgi:hypothetical protein